MTTIDEIVRAHEPERIAKVMRDRPRGTMPEGTEAKFMIIAADHPARGALAASANPMAMADRRDLLARCVEALSRPAVQGFLGTADIHRGAGAPWRAHRPVHEPLGPRRGPLRNGRPLHRLPRPRHDPDRRELRPCVRRAHRPWHHGRTFDLRPGGRQGSQATSAPTRSSAPSRSPRAWATRRPTAGSSCPARRRWQGSWSPRPCRP